MVLRDFPEVSLSTLRVTKSLDTGKKMILGDPATFSITCLPKGKDPPRKTPGEGKDKDKAKGGSAVAKSE